MNFYKLQMDRERDNDILAHYEDDCGIYLTEMVIGRRFEGWDERFSFYYDQSEESFPSDYLANDKGWFVVSDKLKWLMESLNTEIQYLPVEVWERNGRRSYQYYIANILKMVDALCLEKSDYFTTNTKKLGPIHTVSKFAVYEDKVGGADVFKLVNRQEIPIFVSERFKERIEEEGITGIELMQIRTV